MRDQDLLTIDEVGVYIGRSQHTINYWYLWKKSNPDHELAQLLPNYVQLGNRQTRYWHRDDLWKLIEFRSKVPQGRGGIMKDAIHKYFYGKDMEENNGKVRNTDTAVCIEQTGT